MQGGEQTNHVSVSEAGGAIENSAELDESVEKSPWNKMQQPISKQSGQVSALATSTQREAATNAAQGKRFDTQVRRVPPRDMKRLKKTILYKVVKIEVWGGEQVLLLEDGGRYKLPRSCSGIQVCENDTVELVATGFSPSRNLTATEVVIRDDNKEVKTRNIVDVAQEKSSEVQVPREALVSAPAPVPLLGLSVLSDPLHPIFGLPISPLSMNQYVAKALERDSVMNRSILSPDVLHYLSQQSSRQSGPALGAFPSLAPFSSDLYSSILALTLKREMLANRSNPLAFGAFPSARDVMSFYNSTNDDRTEPDHRNAKRTKH